MIWPGDLRSVPTGPSECKKHENRYHLLESMKTSMKHGWLLIYVINFSHCYLNSVLTVFLTDSLVKSFHVAMTCSLTLTLWCSTALAYLSLKLTCSTWLAFHFAKYISNTPENQFNRKVLLTWKKKKSLK